MTPTQVLNLYDTETRGYRLAVPKFAHAGPLAAPGLTELWPWIEAVFRKQTALWNALVEIDAEHRRRFVAIIFSHPGIAEAEAAKERAQADVAALERKDGRRNGAIATAKEAQAALKALRKAALEAAKPEVEKLEQWRRIRISESMRESHLWWCLKEPLLERYEWARKNTLKKAGRFHPADDHLVTGLLRVRWQAGLPVRELLAGEDSRAGLRIERATDRKVEARLRIAVESPKDGRCLTVPIVLSRPLPIDGTVRSVSLFLRREAGRLRWFGAVIVTAPRHAPPPHRGTAMELPRGYLVNEEYWELAMRRLDKLDWLKTRLPEERHEWLAQERDRTLKRAQRRRLQDWREMAKSLATDHAGIRMFKAADRRKLSGRTDSPAASLFAKILSNACEKTGTEVEFFCAKTKESAMPPTQ